jgi:RecB family exonuclease
VITPRTTRLVRAADLSTFRGVLVGLACAGNPFDIRDRLIVIPTRAAAAYLTHAIERSRLEAGQTVVLPEFVTRGELYDRLVERLPQRQARLTDVERETLAGVACRRAAEHAAPPFRLRPGLIAEIVHFYDTLRRNLKDVETFERLALGALEPGAAADRGTAQLVDQTRFLVTAFRLFEQLSNGTGGDEHSVRLQLVTQAAARPWRHVVVAVRDRALDMHGLFAADWDLLARLPGLEQLDVVTTDNALAGVFHERIHQRLPGIEETRLPVGERQSPQVVAARGGDVAHLARDREEEVAGFARWVRQERLPLDRTALVVRQPLPYVYLGREVLTSAGIPSQMFDALPLAAEPYSALLDLVFSFAANCGRTPAVALLRSPHLRFRGADGDVTPQDVTALDRALGDAGYLGDIDALERLIATWRTANRGISRQVRAAEAGLAAARELLPLRSAAPCAAHLDRLLAFLETHEHLADADDPLRARVVRGRAAILDLLTALRGACEKFDRSPVEFETVAAIVRRRIEAHTFAPRAGDRGVHVVDADTAPFGDFDAVQLAGLVDGEWPDAPRRNIFFPMSILRDLGWPLESERLHGMRTAFNDLLRLPSAWLRVSTFTLENDAVVAPSPLLDAVSESTLPTVDYTPTATRVFDYEALALDPIDTSFLRPSARLSALRRVRAGRVPRAPAGVTRGQRLPAYSVSALERYQDCPFRFFAADILDLDEPVEDEPMRSPRARGRFIHEVFRRFFEAWDACGAGTITAGNIDAARALFAEVAEPLLAQFPEAEAALERAQLFGSAAAPGIVDLVLGLEASRPAEVRERWLEYRLEGTFSLGGTDGRRVPLKGVADRIDLLDGHRLRVIDYKTGYPPNPKRALQTPIYGLCAEERLTERDGCKWSTDEAAYVAFAGKRPLVPVIRPRSSDTAKILQDARTRLLAVIDGVERGEYPPKPYETRICGYCAYPSVCRKDYVGDE